MRNFVIVGHKATTSSKFSLEDIPGTSGRLDILCRSITAAFVVSHGIRKDVNVFLILLGGASPKTICLQGESLRHLNPDERTTAALLKKALALPTTSEWTMSTSGVYIRSGGLQEVLADLKPAKMLYLREDGKNICILNDIDASSELVFILGDHLGMNPEEETLLINAGADIVSIGQTSLHADHCIVIIHYLFDSLKESRSQTAAK